jgi:hypothetical protein
MRLSRLPALLAFVAALILSGCKGPCRQLTEKLCECSQTTLEREACLRQASAEDSRVSPSAEDEAVCRELLPGCDCRIIDTPEGKKACGLSR